MPWRRRLPRQASCRGSRGFPRLGSRRGSSSSGAHLILCVYDLDEDLHATTEVSPEPWFQCSWLVVLEPAGSRVVCSAGVGQVAPARLLPGPRRPPRQGSCQGGGSPPRPLALCISGLGVASGRLVLSAPLLCPAQCGRGRGSSCPYTSRGVKRSGPTFVHRQ